MTEKKSPRTPGRKLAKEDLAKATGGRAAALIPGCCTQDCCSSSAVSISKASSAKLSRE